MRCRFVLVLLFMCVVDSEVLFDHFGQCSQFFFKKLGPVIEFAGLQPYNIPICQRFENEVFFATLYLPLQRIPLFSAYRLDTFYCRYQQRSRRSNWFIEPQLYNRNADFNMGTEGSYPKQIKEYQAINEDYRNTNYDRGHLNPCSYQCDDPDTNKFARTATFTLTNAVPQDPCFNRQNWMAMEQESKRIMKALCGGDDAKRYFVTGVFPSSDLTIPFVYDEENDQQRECKRVNVPSVMWTAACCFPAEQQQGFSFSYYGYNKPDSKIEVFPVDVLQKTFEYKFKIFLRIFQGNNNCFAGSTNSFVVFLRLSRFAERMNRNTLARNGN